jgi:SAM-dependent methyltransferase
MQHARPEPAPNHSDDGRLISEMLQRETERLIESWRDYDPGMLRDYLISGVEDPRLNVQSILSRHFLADELFPGQFMELMEAELEFAIVMNWFLGGFRSKPCGEELESIRHALERGSDNADGLELPFYLRRAFARLPRPAGNITIPGYLEQLFQQGHEDDEWLPATVLGTFQQLWSAALAGMEAPRVSVLEPACGSANDYRFIHAYGLARFLDYTGFDLCEHNVANARALFPAVPFDRGNVFDPSAIRSSVDYVLTHDVFEHLSLEGMERAISELCRMTRRALCAGFFSMQEISDHVERPVRNYHCNTLSLAKTRLAFERKGFSVQTIRIDPFLDLRFGCRDTHNPNACTLIARRKA